MVTRGSRGHTLYARGRASSHRAAPAAPYSGVEPQASSLQRTHRRGTARERKIARDGIGENTDATLWANLGPTASQHAHSRRWAYTIEAREWRLDQHH